MGSQQENQRLILKQRLLIVLLCVVLFFVLFGLCGCLPLPTGQKTKTLAPGITPTIASFTPARILQLCQDTKPLVPDPLFKAAVSLVADMLESPSAIQMNEGKVEVYISYVTSSSYLKDAFSFTVPAIGADKQPMLSPTPDPAKYPNPYDHANAVATVTSANATALATAQTQWSQNQAALTAARNILHQNATRLRGLPNIDDPTGEDVGSCLQSAQERMAGFVGRKTIILSSPLAEDVRTLPFIDLSGITVEVINWNCVFSSAALCIASRNAWKDKLLSFHALSVSIHDPQQSLVERPTC